jgi:hypothetical protein
MRLRLNGGRPLAAAIVCLTLVGCFERWQALSVSDLRFPDDCTVADAQFDAEMSADGVPAWTGRPAADAVCATVLVKLLESDPTEPLPDELGFSTSFAVVEGTDEETQRGAGYTLSEPEAVSRLRVVGLIARGPDAMAQVNTAADGYAFEVGGPGIEALRCTLHPGTGAIECD